MVVVDPKMALAMTVLGHLWLLLMLLWLVVVWGVVVVPSETFWLWWLVRVQPLYQPIFRRRATCSSCGWDRFREGTASSL